MIMGLPESACREESEHSREGRKGKTQRTSRVPIRPLVLSRAPPPSPFPLKLAHDQQPLTEQPVLLDECPILARLGHGLSGDAGREGEGVEPLYGVL